MSTPRSFPEAKQAPSRAPIPTMPGSFVHNLTPLWSASYSLRLTIHMANINRQPFDEYVMIFELPSQDDPFFAALRESFKEGVKFDITRNPDTKNIKVIFYPPFTERRVRMVIGLLQGNTELFNQNPTEDFEFLIRNTLDSAELVFKPLLGNLRQLLEIFIRNCNAMGQRQDIETLLHHRPLLASAVSLLIQYGLLDSQTIQQLFVETYNEEVLRTVSALPGGKYYLRWLTHLLPDDAEPGVPSKRLYRETETAAVQYLDESVVRDETTMLAQRFTNKAAKIQEMFVEMKKTRPNFGHRFVSLLDVVTLGEFNPLQEEGDVWANIRAFQQFVQQRQPINGQPPREQLVVLYDELFCYATVPPSEEYDVTDGTSYDTHRLLLLVCVEPLEQTSA